ncbi:proline-rich protein 2-like [Tyto alba]|uniref:proline-rich protein 2-like n=1 Tax=Tyto alba TaxID=56313 RepID=UPI001C668D10|nr:proline-rich protein 2-like [Tyto alba]
MEEFLFVKAFGKAVKKKKKQLTLFLSGTRRADPAEGCPFPRGERPRPPCSQPGSSAKPARGSPPSVRPVGPSRRTPQLFGQPVGGCRGDPPERDRVPAGGPVLPGECAAPPKRSSLKPPTDSPSLLQVPPPPRSPAERRPRPPNADTPSPPCPVPAVGAVNFPVGPAVPEPPPPPPHHACIPKVAERFGGSLPHPPSLCPPRKRFAGRAGVRVRERRGAPGGPVWQRSTRALLTFGARALGSNGPLRCPPISPPTHTHTLRGWIWLHLGPEHLSPKASLYLGLRHQGIRDNSWSGLFIPVGNTSLYGLQDAVGGSGTKRASNVKAPSEEEIILPGPSAWTLEGMAPRSDLKAPSLWVETLLCVVHLARKAARGHLG